MACVRIDVSVCCCSLASACLSAQTPNIEGDKLPPDSYLLLLVSQCSKFLSLFFSPNYPWRSEQEGKHNHWEKAHSTQLVIVRSVFWLFPPLFICDSCDSSFVSHLASIVAAYVLFMHLTQNAKWATWSSSIRSQTYKGLKFGGSNVTAELCWVLKRK